VPKNTPKSIIAKLNAAAVDALGDANGWPIIKAAGIKAE
jgi:hypothetical protein